MAMLFRNASWSGGAAAFRGVLALAHVLLAVRLLGVESYDYVAAVLSLFVVYLSLSLSMFTVVVVRLVALRHAESGADSSAMFGVAALFAVMSIVVLAVATLVLRELAPRIMFLEFANVRGLLPVSKIPS